MKNRKRVAILLSVLLVALMMASGCSQSVEDQTETVTLTDLAGREVEVAVPAEKVVLISGRHIHEFSALMGASFAEKIVGWGSDLEAWDNDTYNVFLEAFPEIADIQDIGYHSQGTFNAEQVIALDPDVIIFPLWDEGDEAVMADIEKLEQAGIPSVFVDFYTDPFNNPVESIELMGEIVGEEERAAEISAYYQEQVDLVADRLADIDTAKPTVYVEVGSKGVSEYGNSYSDTGWGAVIEKAGGDNIAEAAGQISPEYLINESPEVIIISGSNWSGTEGSMKLGFYAEAADSVARLTKFTERAGWDTISAVQNGRVYGIYHGLSFRIYNFAGIQAFAKWFYPEEFADVDPAENFQEFYDKFMPVELTGVWMTGIDE